MNRRSAAPVVAGIVLLGLWEGMLGLTDTESFVLPPPSRIVAALAENTSAISHGAAVTGSVVLVGAAAGVLLGVAAALVVTRSRSADRALTPLAATVNAIPIVALAPIFNAWFGLTSPRSHQAVVAVVTFFPVFLNTAKGLTEVDEDQLELMHSYAASEWAIARRVRIPNALPFFFASLKIVASLAVISAIVAEYFGGRQDSLGPLIVQSAGLSRYDDAWAAVAAGAGLGIGLYLLVVVIEKLAVPWRPASLDAGVVVQP